MPTPPEALGPGEEQTVAMWRSGDLAAVLSIALDPDNNAEQYIDVLHRSDGRWLSEVSSGSDWPVAYGDRLPGQPPAMLTGLAGLSSAGSAWSGIARRGVDRVRAQFPDGTSVECRVEPVTGAFIVGGTGSQEPAIATVG